MRFWQRSISMRFCLLFFAGLPSLAVAQVPDAGRLLNDQQRNNAPMPKDQDNFPVIEQLLRPLLKEQSDVTINVTDFMFENNTVYSNAELKMVIDRFRERSLGIRELNEIAGAVTLYYRNKGYFLAQAYIPEQDINQGLIRVIVLEGTLNSLQIQNNSAVSDERIKGYLNSLEIGKPLSRENLERALLLVNDIPGVSAQSVLKPGAVVGSTDIILNVVTQNLLTGEVEVNNDGNSYTGQIQLGVDLNVAELFDSADKLSIHAVQSTGSFTYGRLAYQLPAGDTGLQTGLALSSVQYRLGKSFSSLQANGKALDSTLFANYPLYRARSNSVYVQFNADHKDLRDNQDATHTGSQKTVNLVSASLFGNSIDSFLGGGNWVWNTTIEHGQLSLDAISLAEDKSAYNTAGAYSKFAWSVERVQKLGAIGNNWSGSLRVAGQNADKNMDTSEKMNLGGVQGVQAYPQGEAPVDVGFISHMELRDSLNDMLLGKLFYDYGRGHSNRDPVPAETLENRQIHGTGIGVNGSYGGFNLEMALAWRGRVRATSDTDHVPRLWLSLQNVF